MNAPMTKSCEACGGLVSLAAPACPHCGHPQQARGPAVELPAVEARKEAETPGGAWRFVLMGLGALLFIAWLGSGRDDHSGFSAPAQSTAVSSAPRPTPPSDADRMLAAMPPAQLRFIDVVAAGRRSYNAGQNEMQKGAARPERAQALCALNIFQADGWVGRIQSLSSNNEGRGVLSITIGQDIDLKTWNNAISDIGSETLLQPGSAVFVAASAMRPGQLVRFSAGLLRDRTDCVREGSVTMRGSMLEPEFIARFQRIEPL